MKTVEHRLFPFGMWCTHCECWHDLYKGIGHREVHHYSCSPCQSELSLAQALLDEAADALQALAERIEA